jgi:hypothetical protein
MKSDSRHLIGLDWVLKAMCVGLLSLFVVPAIVAPFIQPNADEGSRWFNVIMAVYLVLSLVSAILVSVDRKRRGMGMSWVPNVLFFCVLAFPSYMLVRRRREDKSASLQT